MELRGTTILGVRKDGMCAIAGDGQVTLGENTIMKHSAKNAFYACKCQNVSRIYLP